MSPNNGRGMEGARTPALSGLQSAVIVDAGEVPSEAPEHTTLWPDTVIGLGTVAFGMLIAASSFFAWVEGPPAASGWDVYRDRVAFDLSGNPLVLGIDEDGWYTAVFGPGMAAAAGVSIVVIGAFVASTRRQRAPVPVLLGLAASLFSVGAAGYSRVSSYFFEIDGLGVRLWAACSVVVSILMMIGVVLRLRLWPMANARALPPYLGWLSPLLVLSWLPLAVVVYSFEDYAPFATWAILLGLVATLALPASGTVIGVGSLVQRTRARSALVPAGLAFALGLGLFGLLLRRAFA